MATLQKAVVKSLPGDPNMVITLTIGGKQRNMDRPKDELLEKPLTRLQKSALPNPGKQQKRQQGKKGTQAAAAAAGAQEPAAATAAPAGAAAAGPVSVALYAGPSAQHPVLDAAAVTNEEAWRQGRLLCIGESLYQVEVNPPMVDRVELHARPFVGIPLVPVPQLHFADEADCRWQWYRQRPGGAMEALPGATARRYTPTADDAGCLLRVECTPTRQAGNGSSGEEVLVGAPLFSADHGPVAVPPTPAAMAPRHVLTQQPVASPDLRVVTYNILADQYAGTDVAKKVLFAYCPLKYLEPDYRRPLVLAELLGFNADIMCLQEVDEKAFTAYLAPQLAEEGYRGVYTNKAGKPGLSVREGSATFFRISRFSLAAQRDLKLKEFFPAQPSDTAKYGVVFADMLRSSPHLQAALQRIATVAQLSLLAPKLPTDRPVCVLNTHLFFHYMAPHIRTMHVWAMMQEAQAFIDEAMADAEVLKQLGGRRPTLLFCGDLNSDLNDGIPGAIELLAKGQLPADFWDWYYGAGFRWEKGEDADGGAEEEAQQAQQTQHGSSSNGNGAGPQAAQAVQDGTVSSDEYGEVLKQVHSAVEHAHPPGSPNAASQQQAQQQEQEQEQQQFVAGVDLQIPFKLQPADQLRTPFTNYVKGYTGLLDYIWYQPSDVEVVREVPLPTLEEMGGFLPSERFPSDHLPVVFDLRFKAADGSSSSSGSGGVAASSGGGSDGAAGTAGGSGSGAGTGADAGSSSGGDGESERLRAAANNILPAAMYNVGAAVEALRRDEVLAVPTDTLYGLAACANSSRAVRHIYRTKERVEHKPLAICVADLPDVALYGETRHLPEGLVEDLLPGPYTLLLTRRADAPLAAELNPGAPAIGIRIPEYAFIRAVARQHRSALALTSANVSGCLSSVRIEEFSDLWPACGLVLDGGVLDAGRAGSTVVDLTQPGHFRVQRRGNGFSRLMQLLPEKYGLKHVI